MKIVNYFLLSLFFYFAGICSAQVSSPALLANMNIGEYEGIYLPPISLPQLKKIEVIRKEEKLLYSVTGTNTQGELIPITKTKFSCSGKSDWKIEFIKWNDWDVSHMILTVSGVDYRLVKNGKITSEVPKEIPTNCKTVTVSVCINHEANLHIKNNTLVWEPINDETPPGTHMDCGIPTTVNNKEWKDWKMPYLLEFNTAKLVVQPFFLCTNDVAQLTKAPEASNNWETVIHFLDPSAYPHSYSILLNFCPEGTIQKPIVQKTTKDPSINIFVDTTLYPKFKTGSDMAIHKVFFEPGKTELTREAMLELKTLYDTLKTNDKTVDLIGFEKRNGDNYQDWKLYYERSFSVSLYLINIGLNQKRIRFFGYGEDDKIIDRDLKDRIKLAIKDRK